MNLPKLGDPLAWNRPRWQGQTPFYEVYFLKLNTYLSAPQANRQENSFAHIALWLRYTLTAPIKASPYAEVWVFLFSVEEPRRSCGAKSAAPIEAVHWQDEFPLRVGDAGELSHTTARGSLQLDGRPFRWELRWEPAETAVGLFPRWWMYCARFPRTKYVSPHWDVKISGTVSWGQHRWQIQDAPAQEAHLWGTRYAERWIWAHCNAFENAPNAVFEGLMAQVRLGRWLSPPLCMLYLRVDGHEFFTHRWRTLLSCSRESHRVGEWHFEAVEDDWRLVGRLTAQPAQILGARYTDPDGSHRWCHNTKIGQAHLQLYRRASRGWERVRDLHASSTCAVEWVEPMPDERIDRWV